MSTNDFGRQVADALVSAPRFAGRGAFTVHLGERVRGHITKVDAIEVRFGEACERYWVKRYTRAGDAYKEWAFLSRRKPFAGFDLADAVAYLTPPLDALVTAHAGGEKLIARFEAGGRRDAIDKDCFAVGRWLAELHADDTAGERGEHPRDSIVQSIADRLYLVARTWGVPSSVQRAAIGETERRIAGSPPDALARVRTHGDFAPFNILIGTRGGTILDPSFEASIDLLENRCARGEDAARFLTCIDFMESLRIDERRNAGHRFLDGYGSSGVDVRTPALTIFRFKYRLQGLIDCWGLPMADARRLGVPAMIEAWLMD